MPIDPATLSALAAGASILGSEYLKGIAGEAGKSAWGGIKLLFGWESDPAPIEISAIVSDRLTASPEIAGRLLELLEASQVTSVSKLAGEIKAKGHARVVVAQNINNLQM
jgi:hypothetical protein